MSHDTVKAKEGLSQQMLGGVFWSAIDRFGQNAVRFFVQIFLARILAPEQFGLVAMVSVFIVIAKGITDAGFSQAIIQRKDLTHEDLCTVFYFNLSLSCGLMLAVWLAAPFIAQFYSQPELTSILRCISAVVIFDALGRIHLSQLTRKLHFRKLVKVTFIPAAVSGVLAIALAALGWGVWALAMQMLVQSALYSICLWFTSPFRPTLVFSWSSLSSLFSYGSKLAIAGFLNTVFNNIFTLVIGRVFGASDVGFYNRAVAFKNLASRNLAAIIGRVTFPVYAKLQDDLPRLRRGFLRSISVLAIIFFPLMGLLSGVSEPFVVFMIGEQWLPSADYLSILCLVGAAYPIHVANLNILKALGHSGVFLKLEIIKKIMVLSVLLVTYRYGILVMIWGQVLTTLMSFWINAYYTRVNVQIGYFEQLVVLVPPTLLAGAVFLVSSLVSGAIDSYSGVRLLLGCLAGGAIAVVGFWCLRGRYSKEAELLFERLPVARKIFGFLYQN